MSDVASDVGDVEALEVTLAVRSCTLNQCSGFLGYMDIFVTVDWTDHRSRTSRLSRTPTAWGCTTQASWDCACPPKVWYRNQGEHFEVNQQPSQQPQQQPQQEPGSVTFSVFQEALGGFGTPSLLGTAFGIMEDFVEAESPSTGSRENEYVLALNGEATGNIMVDCHWVPAALSRRGAMIGKGNGNLLTVGAKTSNGQATMRLSTNMAVKPRATTNAQRMTVAAIRSDLKIVEGNESSDSSDAELDDDIMRAVQAKMSSHAAKRSLEATLGICQVPSAGAGKSVFLRKSLAPAGGLSGNNATTADLKSSTIKLTETRKKSDEEVMMDNIRRGSAKPAN
mmetsp:Transcript_68205/g.142533  ORF Transcript_68205/g.142533 Transcript_68205/m.142533 type:complete len:338 (-) Transcript_68205:489-1502(-)